VATIALSVAVGGTAVAATTINGANIKNQSIAGFKLKNQAVGTAQIADSSVQSRDLQNSSVTVSKLKSGAVTSAKLANGAVTGPKIAAGAVTGADIAGNTIQRSNLAPAARVPSVIVRQSAVGGVLNGARGEITATCNPGETLIGGGAGTVSAPATGFAVISSRPQPVGSAPTSWLVIVSNTTGATHEFSAYAICASSS
jgi:hypothetical protein